MQDVRYALRWMARSPAFTAVAVLTLALGIGANSAVFSLVDAVLLRPLSYPEPERLVWLWESNAAQKLLVVPASPADFGDWRRQCRSFDTLAAWRDVNLTLTGGEVPERISGARVFPELLGVLSARPALGLAFGAEEGVAMVSYGLWQRRFGGDPSLVGRAIQLDGASYTVAGILPREFQFPFSRVEILLPWIPAPGEASQRGARFRFLRVVARLKAGVSLEQARAETATVARRLEEAYPASNQGWSVNVMPLREFFIAEFRLGFVALMASVGLVVLIACVNVANLLLARAAGRRREIAIRTALGAGRLRLLGQLLTESLLLSLIGGGAGLFLAWIGVQPLVALIPEMNLPIPGLDSVRIDLRAAGFTLALSVVTGALFGVAPLARSSAQNLHEALKEGGRGGTGGTRSRRLRSILVVCEIALAVVLSVCAGLMLRSFERMTQVDPGFRAAGTLTFRVSLPAGRYAQPARQRAFFRQLTERLRALPGAVEAGATNYIPLSGLWGIVRFTIDGQPRALEETPTASNQVVTPSYFQALGIRLAAGRGFSEQDDENSARVAVVNESLARRYWPGASALGQRLRLDGESPDTPPLTVVGVIRDVRQLRLEQEATPELYRCYYQAPTASMSVALRANSDPLALAGAARREVAALDPNQPVYNMEPLERTLADSMWQTRLVTTLFGVFSALALALAAIGIYGLTACTVAQRTREIGLRMALGASSGGVIRLVLGQGLALALAGVAGGLVAAYLFARVLADLLYGVGTADPATYVTAPLVLLLVALAANLVPALRAARTDPIAALRQE
ncbi:MAG: ABC transporter permease [Acidobacteria bacterium]|nr:ABC transporter permease [Acidobacteriota bacterium]